MKETRGPKVKLTPVQVGRLSAPRKELIRKAAGEGEVHIVAKAKTNHVSNATVAHEINDAYRARETFKTHKT